MSGRLRGVVFDMDGVLVDSEPFIAEAAIRMFAEHGVTVRREDFAPFVGAGEDRYLSGVADKYGFDLEIERDKARTYAIYDEIVRGKLAPLPGSRELVEEARRRNLAVAMATSADPSKVRSNLREINMPESSFDVAINGLDVARKKPHPDIYLRAAVLMGLPPRDCLVVEDAVNGVSAAKAAGARCLAVTTSFSREELAEADWICHDLTEFPAEALNW